MTLPDLLNPDNFGYFVFGMFFVVGAVKYVLDIRGHFKNGKSNYRRQADEDARKFFEVARDNQEMLIRLGMVAEGCVKLHERQYALMETHQKDEEKILDAMRRELTITNEKLRTISCDCNAK